MFPRPSLRPWRLSQVCGLITPVASPTKQPAKPDYDRRPHYLLPLCRRRHLGEKKEVSYKDAGFAHAFLIIDHKKETIIESTAN